MFAAMNKPYLFAYLSLVLLAVSCGDDDDQMPETESIVGEWRLLTATNEARDYGFFGLTYTYTEVTDGEATITFNDDGTFARAGIVSTYSLLLFDADTIINDTERIDFASTGTYVASDNKLRFTNDATPTQGPSLSELYDYSIGNDRLVFQIRQDTTVYIEDLDSTLTLFAEIYNELERK